MFFSVYILPYVFHSNIEGIKWVRGAQTSTVTTVKQARTKPRPTLY